MNNPNGIIVFGASGSGTTTLGRELARVLNFEHHDIDDYVWKPTTPSYTQMRSQNERVTLLRSAIKGDFVLSGCLREWEGAFDDMLRLAVFIKTPTELRLERVEQREYARYGDRIKPGGDMYEKHRSFAEYIATYDTGSIESRSLASQTAWLKTLACPVIEVCGVDDFQKTAKKVAKIAFGQNRQDEEDIL